MVQPISFGFLSYGCCHPCLILIDIFCRPVTVRSVKRRDRGKSLERRIGQEAAVAAKSQLAANMAAAAHQHTSLPNVATAGNGYMTNDEKAVMV